MKYSEVKDRIKQARDSGLRRTPWGWMIKIYEGSRKWRYIEFSDEEILFSKLDVPEMVNIRYSVAIRR